MNIIIFILKANQVPEDNNNFLIGCKKLRSEQDSDCSRLYFMKNSSLDPKNILLRDQRVVKMHLFFTRKMMVGSNFLLVIHIPQGMEVSKSTVVLKLLKLHFTLSASLPANVYVLEVLFSVCKLCYGC